MSRGVRISHTKHLNAPPEVCTKPGCGGKRFVKHVDGWQCLNCMQIIYRKQPVIAKG